MNRVLRDYFRRWWWMIALAAGGQMLLMGAPASGQRLAPLFSLFIGIIPVIFFDFSRGIMRALVQLPIRREEMASKLWLVTVVFPAVVTIVVSLAGPVVYRFLPPNASFNPMNGPRRR